MRGARAGAVLRTWGVEGGLAALGARLGRGVGAGDGAGEGGGDSGPGESAVAAARRDGVVRVFDGVGLLRGGEGSGPVVGGQVQVQVQVRDRYHASTRDRYHVSTKPGSRGRG